MIKKNKEMETKMKLNSIHSHLCFLLILFSSVPSFVVSFNEELEGEDIERSEFPDDFFFGTSTSSYQVFMSFSSSFIFFEVVFLSFYLYLSLIFFCVFDAD